MNEYNYDYLRINGMVPNDVLNFMNGIPQNNMGINNPNIEFSPNNGYNQAMNNSVLDPTEGFIRGNMFADLYDQYNNYKPVNLNPKNEKDAMLMSYMQYDFALNDLNLYLDIYPNDRNLLNLYRQYLDIAKDIKEEYEKKYGPLSSKCIYAVGNNFMWDNNPWPWEVM